MQRTCQTCNRQTDQLTCPHDGTPTVVPDHTISALVGQVVGGRYLVTKLIGEGGFGAVYEAQHQGTGDLVAIKVLRTEQAGSAEMVGRFQQEAAVTASLKQPHTVRVFDFGQTPAGDLYLAMEFLDGHTLTDIATRQAPMGYQRATHIAVQVLKSLAEAHARGLVHRDLKPDNIFVQNVFGEEDFVKVLDFGIAKSLSVSGQSRTATGVIIGTPPYMSPEQARGSGVDTRTDLYALGCILYELLTGEVPFAAESAMDTLIQRITQPPPRAFGACRAPTPRAVCDVVHTLMATDPAHRYDKAQDVIVALQGAAAQAPDPDSTAAVYGADVFAATLSGEVDVVGGGAATVTGKMPGSHGHFDPAPTMAAARPQVPAMAAPASVPRPVSSPRPAPRGPSVRAAAPTAGASALPGAGIPPAPSGPVTLRRPLPTQSAAAAAAQPIRSENGSPEVAHQSGAAPASKVHLWIGLGAAAVVGLSGAIWWSTRAAPPPIALTPAAAAPVPAAAPAAAAQP
ncbi:MAG: protein kinase, partial [Deltaproteobacteria bacterium]|nr:protein kinase [Deltaproteobacteria bacterium]